MNHFGLVWFMVVQKGQEIKTACLRALGPAPPGPKGLETLADYPDLTDAMLRRGWSPRRVEKIMGGNRLRLFREVWAGR